MRELYHDPEYLKSTLFVRNGIDGLQDIYFLRKRSLVDDHHWRNWISAFGPPARMALTREIFENAVSREAFRPAGARSGGHIAEAAANLDLRRDRA